MCRFERRAKEIMEGHRMDILKQFSEIPPSASYLLDGSTALLKEILRTEAEGIGFDGEGFRKRLTRKDKEFLKNARGSIERFVNSARRLSESWAQRKEV